VATGRGRAPAWVWAWCAGATSTRVGGSLALPAKVAAAIIEDDVARAEPHEDVATDAVATTGGVLILVRQTGGPPRQTTSRIKAAVRRIGRDGPTEPEMVAARRRLLGEHLFRIETCAGLAREIGRTELLGDGEAALRVERTLSETTREDVRAFVSHWLLTGSAGASPSQ
jgi:hypothetical protein